MRISDTPIKLQRLALCAGVVACLFGTATPTLGFDPDRTFGPDQEPRSVLRFGYQALKSGKVDDALNAFRFGASRDDLASQWKLARMLQDGAGVKQDDLAAYELYSRIAQRFGESPPNRHDMPYVSHAVTMLGVYTQNGIEGSYVKPSSRRAEDHFYRAAALYKDPEAQFRLGVLYSGDTLGAPRVRSAARWLGLAARKGHVRAQARLGEMLFYGRGVPRRPVKGLVYMAKAARYADFAQNMHDAAVQTASEAERVAAERIVAALDTGQGAASVIANSSPVGGVATTTAAESK